MAENIEINGTTYPGVESVELNTTDGKKVLYFEGQPVSIVHGPGSDESAVMSQKAVTAMLNDLTLGYHTDGLIYIFSGDTPLGNGIEMTAGGDVVGYVDSANNIVVTGKLADGAYTVKYEMEDGKTVNIGNLVLDTNVYYSVANNLTNCTNSNSAAQVIEGQPYNATITAKSGYELKSVTVTMGGSAVTVSNGKINISSVTGKIVITAVAEEIKAKYTNLANPTSSDWGTNKRLGSDGTFRDETGTTVTNYIPIYAGQTIYIKGMDLTSKNCGIYSDTKAVQSVTTLAKQTVYMKDISATATGGSATWQYTNGGTAAKPWYIRIAGVLNGTANDVIITINEPIE